MNSKDAYVSMIYDYAEARPVDYLDNSGGTAVEYYVGTEKVGRRVFASTGDLEWECAYRGGKKHGWEYRWDEPGVIVSATPYVEGVEHGTAYQWAEDGSLIGTYTMEHGTGLDLWWREFEGSIELAEARQVRDSLWDGFEYWIKYGSQEDLITERWWSNGKKHGIEREWNGKCRLRRGYPQY